MSLITFVTRIHFAEGVLEDALAVEAPKLGLRRPAIIFDAAAEAGDALGRVLHALPADVSHAPPRRAPERIDAAELAREAVAWAEAGCDGVIGVGGPAALDLARALGRAGPQRTGRAGGVPVVAIPTGAAGVGLGPVAPALAEAVGGRAPALVLCDPTLTVAAGPEATAAAGMDALVHCLEAWLGASWNPPADGIALDGLRRAARWLPRAVEAGGDLTARREMMAAALDAGLAAEKGLGGLRALAHALEEEAGLGARHGALHAALAAPVIAFNAPALGDRLDAARQALGLSGRAEPGAALAALGGRIGLPERLSGLRLDAPALRRVARRAAEDPAAGANPRLATEGDYLAILEAAL